MKKLLVPLALFVFAVACGPDEETVENNNTDPECTGGKCDVIGDDDRYDEFSGEVTELLRETAASTAMLIETEKLLIDGDTVGISVPTLGETYMMCPGERFEEQPSAGFCTGWLVAPDIMITNGHCLTSQQQCETSSFVFDYTYQEEGQDLGTVPAENVVACQRVLAWDYTSNCDVDFAVVQLERAVDREPLQVRGSAEELAEDALVIIGHPFGLPRKFALEGELLRKGSNNFSTTHDIFGGNSGSAIFDGNTGTVQGLVTCGGSNLKWEYIDEGWELERKTGKACDTSCDDEGTYIDGSWEECSMEGTRRRCVCDEDGTQLVWEKRDCLSFEAESGGQCSREATTSLETCVESPWRCATPIMQHTAHFAHFADRWNVWESEAPLEVPMNEEVTSTIAIDETGVAQAFSVYIDLLGTGDAETFDFEIAAADLTITLERGDESYDLVRDGLAQHGTAFDFTNTASGTSSFQVPFVIRDMQALDVAGEWTLRVSNLEYQAYTIYNWRIQSIVKAAEELTELGQPPCTVDCELGWEEGPDPIEENFEGDPIDLEDDVVSGTIAEGWSVEVLDDAGQGYEAFKTRRSQTISLQSGELALVRDFGTEIGGRMLTVDYRYDGDGWFQIWADGQILHSQQSFAQQQVTVPMPYTARTLKFVIGATNDSQYHEATIHSLKLAPNSAEPASCGGIYSCVFSCVDSICQENCISVGTSDAQTEFQGVVDCINASCADLADPEEYQQCINTTCAGPMTECLN